VPGGWFSLDLNIRRQIEQGERTAFQLAAMGLFVVGFVVLATIAAVANSILIAIIAGAFASLFIRAVLPTARLTRWLRSYATGEAGNRWRRRYERTLARLRRFI
jgi:hypothetical protein